MKKVLKKAIIATVWLLTSPVVLLGIVWELVWAGFVVGTGLVERAAEWIDDL